MNHETKYTEQLGATLLRIAKLRKMAEGNLRISLAALEDALLQSKDADLQQRFIAWWESEQTQK